MPLTLDVAQRTVVGRGAHRLRQQGLVPGVVYGHQVEALAVEVGERELGRVTHAAGASHLIQLKVKGERRQRPVLIREVQREPRSGRTVHVDFFQVNLKEKLDVTVPVVVSGEAPAVKQVGGEVLQVLHQLAVNCLPDSIPGEITVDVSGLAEIDDAVRISDLLLPEGRPRREPLGLLLGVGFRVPSRPGRLPEPLQGAHPLLVRVVPAPR